MNKPQRTMDFSLRQKISLKSDFKFNFPKLMDHMSTEKLISYPQDLEGAWRWEDETLVFSPSSALKPKSTYSFLVPGETLTRGGSPLGRDLEFVFTIAGLPKIAAHIPAADAERIAKNSKIAIVFDQPMIALSQVQGEFAKDAINAVNFTIEPKIEGRWRWMSTLAIEFVPSKGLTEGTRYTVTVPKGIKSSAGDETEEDVIWSFETMRPEIVSNDPQNRSAQAGPSTSIALAFNREIDLESAFKGLTLVPTKEDFTALTQDEYMYGESEPLPVAAKAPAGEIIPLKKLRYGEKETDGRKEEDKTLVQVSPANPLAFNTNYALFIAPGIRGTEGSLGTKSGSLLTFRTVGEFKTSRGSFEHQNGQLLRLFFTNLPDEETLSGITFSPPLSNPDEFSWMTSDWSDGPEISGYPALNPSTDYTVTVPQSIKDMYGQPLKEPFTFKFSTPQLTPRVFIHSNGEFGIFEKDKPPVYYFNALNVNELNVSFAKLSLQEFLNMRSSKAGNYDFRPNIGGKNMSRNWTIKPKAGKNQWDSIPFSVHEQVGENLPPGIYALNLTAPEYKIDWPPYSQRTEEQYFALTNLSITLKYSGDSALVWVTDMQTGLSVPNAQIKFYSLSGLEAISGVTDGEGFFETDLPLARFVTANNGWEPEFWVTAQTSDDFAFVGSNWNDGTRPYNFDFASDFRSTEAGDFRMDSYLYTERPIYKAGDTVYFKGIVRLRDWNGRFSIPDGRKISVSATDSQNNTIYSKELAISPYGGFSGDIAIDEKANLGGYNITAQIIPETGIMNNYSNANFSVLAYRKPEYLVEIKPESENYFSGDTVKAQIQGSYYFGAPMGGANAKWRAMLTDYYFNRFTSGWYSFSLEDSWCWYDCERQTNFIAEGSGKLDREGRMTVSVPAGIDDKTLSQIMTIEADVTDENNQVVSSRESAYIHKANAYVGIQPEEYSVIPGSSASVKLVTLLPDGSPLPNKEVGINLFSRTWNSIRKKGVDGEYYYENEPQDTFIRSVNSRTDSAGKGTAEVLIPSGGQYWIVAEVSDDEGHEAKAGASVYSWSSVYVNWPRTNSDRMDIIADKPEYKVGDTAKLLVKSPYQGKGVKALITVEREGIMSRRVIDIESSAQPIEIPVTGELLPTAYVSVVVIKPRMGETFDENGLDTGTPGFKIGYAKLNVNVSSKRLNISIETDKTQYGPGEEVKVNLTASDELGKPVQADVSVGAVDMSLLALSSFETPDLAKLFYSDRGLGVYTSQMLKFLLERFKPGSKGGGGADPESRKRGNFRDTAFWIASAITDGEGKANLSFRLPDNLTTWQILAIGSTMNHLFGSKTSEILETKKVILRPVRPRFAVQNDEIVLGAIVHNFMAEEQEFTVTLAGSGFTAMGSLAQNITIPSGQQIKLGFPIRADAGAKSLTLDFKAQSSEGSDEIEEKIPVYSYTTKQSVATSGFTENQVLEKVIAPSEKEAPEGTLSVSMSPTLAAYLPAALNYLIEFPYGCTEQTLSSFLPSAVIAKLSGIKNLEAIANGADLEKTVTAGLERIYAFQRNDGGFGYWENSLESYPDLTAYVLFGLTLTKESGLTVDQGVIDRTANYLQGVLRKQNLKRQIDLATRAAILNALGEAGYSDLSLINNLNEQRSRLPLFAKAQLAMAYEKAGNADQARKVTEEILNSAKVSSRGTHFEEEENSQWGWHMNTTDRTTALVLQALVRIDPGNALIPNITRYLLSARREGRWDTTQSTVYALLAFAEFLSQTGETSGNFAASAEINGEKVLDFIAGGKNILERSEALLSLDELKRGKENSVKIGLNGKGRLYYDLLMSYIFAGDDIEPAEEGISIRRTIKPLDGKSTALSVGRNYVVTLTVTVPDERRLVAIESPVPAGMEIVDISLETSQKQLLKDVDDSEQEWDQSYWESGLRYFTHKEVRDDRQFLFAEVLPAGIYQYRYVVRATVPGSYHSRPARAYEMYFPETFGQTEGSVVKIEL